MRENSREKEIGADDDAAIRTVEKEKRDGIKKKKANLPLLTD